MNAFDTTVYLVYLGAATCFVLGLHLMNSPASAARGNRLSAGAMAVAVVTTAVVLEAGNDTPSRSRPSGSANGTGLFARSPVCSS